MALRCQSGVAGRGNCLSCPVHHRIKGSVFPTPPTLKPCPLHAQPWQSRLAPPTCPGKLRCPSLAGSRESLAPSGYIWSWAEAGNGAPTLGAQSPLETLGHRWFFLPSPASEPISAGPPSLCENPAETQFPLHHLSSHWPPQPLLLPGSLSHTPGGTQPPASLCLSVCPPQVWGCVFCTPHAPPGPLRSGPSSQFLAWRLPELTPASPGGLSPDTQLAALCCVPLLVGLLLAGTSSYSMIGCCSSRLSSDVASCRTLSRMTVLSPRLQLN